MKPSSNAETSPVPMAARLDASRHLGTGRVFFPRIPADLPVASEYETITLGDEALLYSFTIVHPSPKSGKPPFILAYADFPEGVRVLGRLDGEAAPQVGCALSVAAAEGATGPTLTFRPATRG